MAVKLSGWDTMKRSWNILKQNYNQGLQGMTAYTSHYHIHTHTNYLLTAFKNDPEAKKFFDEDGDGKVSAKEMSVAGKKLFTGTAQQKKAVLMHLRCVFVAIDPQEVITFIL